MLISMSRKDPVQTGMLPITEPQYIPHRYLSHAAGQTFEKYILPPADQDRLAIVAGYTILPDGSISPGEVFRAIVTQQGKTRV